MKASNSSKDKRASVIITIFLIINREKVRNLKQNLKNAHHLDILYYYTTILFTLK